MNETSSDDFQLPDFNEVAEDDFETCECSEDEEDNNNETCTCFLCLNGDDKHGPVAELNAMHQRLSGNVSNKSIYDILHDHYTQNVENPLKQQNIKVASLSKIDIAHHYKYHRTDIKQMLCDDIRFMNIMQKKLREHGIFSENKTTKRKRINNVETKLWTSLCRQKLDIIKYLHTIKRKRTT